MKVWLELMYVLQFKISNETKLRSKLNQTQNIELKNV